MPRECPGRTCLPVPDGAAGVPDVQCSLTQPARIGRRRRYEPGLRDPDPIERRSHTLCAQDHHRQVSQLVVDHRPVFEEGIGVEALFTPVLHGEHALHRREPGIGGVIEQKRGLPHPLITPVGVAAIGAAIPRVPGQDPTMGVGTLEVLIGDDGGWQRCQ
jgi:hypothetical protein